VKDDGGIDALEARLVEAWREGLEGAVSPRWKADVMKAVSAEAARSRRGPEFSIERFVRNACLIASAAAAAAILMLGGRAAALDPTLELARLLVSDPQGLFQLVLVM
jgi:hypothetical protein